MLRLRKKFAVSERTACLVGRCPPGRRRHPCCTQIWLLRKQKFDGTHARLRPASDAVAGEDPVELSRDAVTGAQRSKLSASSGVDAQQQQDLDPVYITTLRPPADGGQQAIVMPRSVTVSEDDPWFGPFYTLNDPDRSVSIDILNQLRFYSRLPIRATNLCNIPGLM